MLGEQGEQRLEAGRSPAACKMLFRVHPIVGASRAEATVKRAEHNALMPREGGLAILSGHLDLNLLTPAAQQGDGPSLGAQLQRRQTRYRSMTGELLALR